MRTIDKGNIPEIPGEKERPVIYMDGNTSSEEIKKVRMNNRGTLLPENAIVEFLDEFHLAGQKRNETDPEDAPKNWSLLCAVNGKQRWISLGTFTRRDYNKPGRPYISPFSKDVPEDIDPREFYDKFKTVKLKVTKLVPVVTNIFEGNVRTEKTQTVHYPVLDYCNE